MSDSIVLERHFQRKGIDDTRIHNRRRVYILPTRNGFLFAATLMVLFLGAINYNNSLAYVLSFLLGSVSLVGLFFTHRNLAGLIINPAQADPVFAGETAYFPLFIDNRGMLQRLSLKLGCKQKPRQWFKPSISIDQELLLDFPHNDIQTVMLPKKMPRRGVHQLGRCKSVVVFHSACFEPGRTSISTMNVLSILPLKVNCHCRNKAVPLTMSTRVLKTGMMICRTETLSAG